MAMPLIPGATGRGLRVLPRLGLGQAVGVLATAVVCFAMWHAPVPRVVRLPGLAAVAGAGMLLSIGSWPPGPQGEAVVRWLGRLAAYGWRRQARAGTGGGRWCGPVDMVGPYLLHPGGCAAVLESGGLDPALGGDDAWVAAVAGYRELLHALERPLQVVVVSRWLRDADRPTHYRTERVPAGLAEVAATYASHWGGLVAARCWVVRRVLLVASAPGRGADAQADIEATVACVQRLAARLGFGCRRLTGDELVAAWREWTGDVCPGARVDGQAGWRVRGWSDA